MPIGLEFDHSCINCGMRNTDERNEAGLPCSVCLPEIYGVSKEKLYEILKDLGSLKNLKTLKEFEKKFEDFRTFFKETVGFSPTGFQKFWMKRLILGKSFTIVAPTGTGKTTFGEVAALWVSNKGKRVLIVLPTILLVAQVGEKLRALDDRVLVYHSRLSKNDKEDALERIQKGDFNILVVSTQFLSRGFDVLSKNSFDFVFVDDVDSVLKSSKNIERLLLLLGFSHDDIDKAYLKITGKIKEFSPPKKHGTIIVSSATAKPRGLKPRLFRELLDFDIGSLTVSSRNVLNVYVNEKSFEHLLKVVNRLKNGILVFAPESETVERIEKFLSGKGIKAKAVLNSGEKALKDFAEGKIDALIGTSSYYGKLVRGIDLPKRVKFAVFYGAPYFKYSLSKSKAPRFILKRVLFELSRENREFHRFLKMIDRVKNLDDFKENLPVSDEEWLVAAKKVFDKFPIEDDFVKIPDVLTYIQASGRTSRLLNFRLTRGVSVLLENDEKLFTVLKERMEWLTEEEWKEWNEVDWDKEFKEIEETRSERYGEKKEFKTVLFVVESPTKAATLSGFFGRSASRRYRNILVHESIVDGSVYLFTASRGHVFDLVTDEGYHGVKVDNGSFIPIYSTIKRCLSCGHQFTGNFQKCPKCGSDEIDDKLEVLRALREIAMEVDEVLISTDPDTEGEKISYDVYQYLKPVNENIKRVELHEITRKEFKKGIESPRSENENLVRAQVVRRVQDRWTGFELSQKVQKYFKNSHLSAGRVQSTVLGWIVEREKEYKESKKIYTSFDVGGRRIEVEGDFSDVEKLRVSVIGEFEDNLNPPPPYTTDAVLSDIFRKLKIGVKDGMRILQELFENGFITYHRTDSTRISEAGIGIARKIFERLGREDIFHPRTWSSEGAHEAIRPAKALSPDELNEMITEGIVKSISKEHIRVYRIIYNRFVVSQSKPVKVKKQKVTLFIGDKKIEDETIAEVLEDGWNLFSKIDTFEYKDGELDVKEVKVYEKHEISLFTQASIIEKMKNEGIGRPSTYSKIVEILFARKYIKEDKYGRIWPTSLGKKVYKYLKERFEEFVTTENTRELEKLMDEVEKKGKSEYTKALEKIYRDALKIRSFDDLNL